MKVTWVGWSRSWFSWRLSRRGGGRQERSPAPTTMIGAEGGMVTSPAGVTIQVPPGAVPRRRCSDRPDDVSTTLPAGISAVGKTFKLSPEGVRFAKVVRVTFLSRPARGKPVIVLREPAGGSPALPMAAAMSAEATITATTDESPRGASFRPTWPSSRPTGVTCPRRAT